MIDDDGPIEISSDDGEIDQHAILKPVISRVVDALGGIEGGAYRLGDEVGGCLKDLKKLWRKDDTDDERTVARIFWETRVLPNDLIPILLETAGKGLVEDKRAIACADLMTAMTWPIDMAEELKELDEELDKGTDYTQLLTSHLHYKAALLKPGVLQALFGIILPPLSKGVKERKERDGQIINVILHLIRNLAFIKDLPSNIHLSADQAELSSLQTKLIRSLQDTHTFQLLLTIAANTGKDPLLNGWNTLILEIFYLLFRGIKPSDLARDQAKQPTDTLHRLLATEARTRRDLARKATSRHTRFGTTISVTLNTNKKTRPSDREAQGGEEEPEEEPATTSRPLILHQQQAIHNEAGSIMDLKKRQRAKKGNTLDELTRDDNLSVEARTILQDVATEFIKACFNPFLSGLLKDIRSERAKITEKDNLRLLYLTKWLLEYFLAMRAKENAKDGAGRWGFGLIAEVTEREWIIWVLKRMREAVEEKPKLWTELQAGVECLTQLLLLIDGMSSSEIADPALNDAADLLQQQLIYNGEVLDIAFESLRTYKEGTQSLAYLDSSIYLAYILLKMLEKWSKVKGGAAYVRKRKLRRKGKKGATEEESIPDVEEEVEEAEDTIQETMFTFEAFEMKFAHAEITYTLLTYLARYKEFASSENMRRVVGLMHRQAVKAKAEGLYFKVSTLDLFKTILGDKNSFPPEQPYKDLVNLVNFILRQFFKAISEDTFLAVEALFPKNRGNWKQYSSWEPDAAKEKKSPAPDSRFPPDVQVKKGYSWSDQVGIVVATLTEDGHLELVNWTKDILKLTIARRQVDQGNDDMEGDDTDDDNSRGPPARAIDPTDYVIPYPNNRQAEAATKNPHLKLLFRLVKFLIQDEVADELQWYVPASVLADDLQRTLKVIDQFLETPIDLGGGKASELLSKKRRGSRRKRIHTDDDASSDGDLPEAKKGAKKKKEKEIYKSAQFIEDSDEEYGDMESFLEKEKAQREKAGLAAAAAGAERPTTMKPTGTKKRRRKTIESAAGKKKRKGELVPRDDSGEDRNVDDLVNSEPEHRDEPTPIARPRPRPRIKKRPIRLSPSPSPDPPPTPNLEPRGSPIGNGDASSASDTFSPILPQKGRPVVLDEED
ncbi:timeless protein-domain-containing protein [Infundibulicybe gibba]|nr:timeless protein-domain-containing protein [Infundibulicybe gibba]